jgi:cytochrome d ubiquinol oxidase subunit I
VNTTPFASYLFGSSMAVHYLLTNALPGIAFGLMLLQSVNTVVKKEKLANVVALFTRLFAIQFSIAVISGLTLETDLHQNWSAAGDVISPLINHPLGRSAFAGFMIISVLLAPLLLHPHKISSGMQWFIYLLIFLSTILLSWWAVVVNSWMNTPAGMVYTSNDSGHLQISITSLRQFIFNPSFQFRFLHIFNAALIEGLMMQCLILIFIIQKTGNAKNVVPALKVSLTAVVFFLIMQPLIGHAQFAVMAKYQPVKAAAFEGYYKNTEPFHYYVLGITEPEKLHTRGIHLPIAVEQKISSTFKKINSLNQSQNAQWLRIRASFYFFHIMLLCWAGMFMLITAVLFKWRKGIQTAAPETYFFAAAFALSVVAPLAGWAASESGRQPWLVYGILKTAAAESFAQNAFDVLLSVIANFILPTILLALWGMLQKAEWNKFVTNQA